MREKIAEGYNRTHQPVFHHPGFQKRLNQLQHPPIADPRADSGHQFVVANPVEKFLQIQVHHPACRWRRKRVPKWRRSGPLPGDQFGVSLSLFSGVVVRNGPEPSRARRCWARRSEPLTARTVLRCSLKRESRGERLAKGGPPFCYPRSPPLTVNRFHWSRRNDSNVHSSVAVSCLRM